MAALTEYLNFKSLNLDGELQCRDPLQLGDAAGGREVVQLGAKVSGRILMSMQ